MLRTFGISSFLLLVPGLGLAADAPERLLPAGTQVYVRWDGAAHHRAAFDQTALGQLLQGETGVILGDLFKQTRSSLEKALRAGGGPPEEKKQALQELAKLLPEACEAVGRDGFLLGLEVRGVTPPDAQATVVFPGAGPRARPVLRTLELLTGLADKQAKEEKLAGRSVHHLEEGQAHFAWCVDGPDLVLAAGTNPPATMLQRVQDPAPNLTGNPRLAKLRGFKDFETGLRGFVDVAALLQVARGLHPQVGPVADELGLAGLRAVTFYAGYDGVASRSLVEVEAPGPRKGILRLGEGKPFRLADLPPLPANATSFAATRFDFRTCYDVGVEAAEAVVRVLDPAKVPQVKQAVQQADQFLGLDVRADLLGTLGDLVVYYYSPSEGPLFFKHVLLVQVKDAAKLRQSLDKAIHQLADRAGVKVQLLKRSYHGAELCQVYVAAPGFLLVPSYVVHKDWLAVGFYPQTVQGYVLRSEGRLPAWKPSASVQKSLARLPQEYRSLAVTDPRPSLQTLVGLAPAVAGLIRSSVPDAEFDVGLIPNALELTARLFPNVTVGSADGQAFRQQTLASLPGLPMEMNSAEVFIFSMAAISSLGHSASATFQKVGNEIQAPAAEKKPAPKKPQPKD